MSSATYPLPVRSNARGGIHVTGFAFFMFHAVLPGVLNKNPRKVMLNKNMNHHDFVTDLSWARTCVFQRQII